MYVPKQFQLTDKALIEQYIRENGFATLVSNSPEYPGVQHISH